MEMERLIARADSWLRRERSDYYGGLAPGCTDDAIAGYEQAIGFQLPPALRGLWRWKGGSDAEALVHNHAFISLDESREIKLDLDGMIGTDFEDPEWWKRSWIPFTRSWGGDSYCVDLIDGRVIDFWHDEPTRNVLAPSFEAWFAELVATMESGELELA